MFFCFFSSVNGTILVLFLILSLGRSVGRFLCFSCTPDDTGGIILLNSSYDTDVMLTLCSYVTTPPRVRGRKLRIGKRIVTTRGVLP